MLDSQRTVPGRGNIWFVTLALLCYMSNFVDRAIVSVLGEMIRVDMRLTDLQLGIMGGLAFALFYAAVSLPLARLADRFNRVRMLAAVTALWSVMSALSGAAANFHQLLLCRMGVAVGEAGLTPALVSMLSDRFPAGRRAAIFSVIAIGGPAGTALAAIGGGLVADMFGWRIAYVIVGLPGLILAGLIFFTLGEPDRSKDSSADMPSMKALLRLIGGSRSFLHLTAGSAFVGVVIYGLNLFLIPLLVRRHGLDLAHAGAVFAASVSLASVVGQLAGGFVADALGGRDMRWYGWAPALGLLVVVPLYVAAILQDDWRWLLVLTFLAALGLGAFLPTVMTVTQSLVEPRMRASAAALHSFGITVGGLGFGSVLLGFASDRFTAFAFDGDFEMRCRLAMSAVPGCAEAAASGLQYALLAAAGALLFAIAHFLLAARALPGDLREAPGQPSASARQ